MSGSITFNRPAFFGSALDNIRAAIEAGHVSGDGRFTRRCHSFLERQLGVKKAFLTTSCTHALEMASLLIDVQPGDEVVVPAYTFVSTANAFVLRGAKPVFADIRPDTLNLDEARLEAHVSPRTKAIVVVHYAGVGCEMDTVLEIAARFDIPVIEDNAHGLFGKYKGQYLGTFGGMATQSFHETKSYTCGEGGALLINDDRYVARAEIIREKGTDKGKFLRGQVDQYNWVDVGSSYLPSDLLAAYLIAQLEKHDQIQAKRRQIWDYYYANLSEWAAEKDVRLPTVPGHCEQAFQLFYLLMPSLEERDAFISHLRGRGILASFHYLPLHRSPAGEKLGGRRGDCPVAENVSERLVRLPFYYDLTMSEQDEVMRAVKSFPFPTTTIAPSN